MDGFIEQIIKPDRKTKNALYIILIISLAVLLPIFCIILGITLQLTYMFVIALFVLMLTIYGAWYFISSLKIEFEYSFSFSKFNISKIIDNRKRKNIISFDVNRINSIEFLNKTTSDMNFKIYDACESQANPNTLLITLNTDKDKEIVGIFLTLESKVLKSFIPYCKPDIQRKALEISKDLTI